MCPILKQEIEFKDSVVDHKWKLKAEEVGINGNGCIRGVIQRFVNVFEGKISRAYVRLGLKSKIELPELLRNLADYIENPPLFNANILYIHPKEQPKKKKRKLGILEANRVYKYWYKMYPKRNLPFSPKSGNVTAPWAKYIKQANALHEQITGKKLKVK